MANTPQEEHTPAVAAPVTWVCRDHGTRLTVSGDRGQHRRIVTAPPPIAPAPKGRMSGGIAPDCVLLTATEIHEGPMQREEIQPSGRRRLLDGVCEIERVGV
jgi:hypothetical protein